MWSKGFPHFNGFAIHSLFPEIRIESQGNKVAYLDGLRGFGAFLVYCAHHAGFAHEPPWPLWNAFGWNDKYYFVCFPFVRLFFCSGAFAVALFFIVSGYVLALGPLKLIQQPLDSRSHLATKLGCSFPRRWVRLYVPVIATTVVFMTCWHLFSIQSASPDALPPKGSYGDEIVRWFREFVNGSNFFKEGGFAANNYNSHLWSIATEYHGSAVIYTLLLCFSALDYSPIARFWSSVGLFLYFLFFADSPAYSLFVMGLLICDLDLLAEKDPNQLPGIIRRIEGVTEYRWFFHIVLLVGVYLGGAPHVMDLSMLHKQPGWAFMAALVPVQCSSIRTFFASCGAVFTMIAVPRIPWLRRFFESSPCQYLGKISFGFYLVHGPIMWTVGDRLLAAVGRPRKTAAEMIPEWIDLMPLSDKGLYGLELNACIPQLLLFPLTIWLADVVTKVLDKPSAALSKRLFEEADYRRVSGGFEIA